MILVVLSRPTLSKPTILFASSEMMCIENVIVYHPVKRYTSEPTILFVSCGLIYVVLFASWCAIVVVDDDIDGDVVSKIVS